MIHIEKVAEGYAARVDYLESTGSGRLRVEADMRAGTQDEARTAVLAALDHVCRSSGLKLQESAPCILVSVDIVLLTLCDGELSTVLLRRDHEPYTGVSTLPGGFIQPKVDGSDLEAARRVLREKTGLQSPYLEQLRTYAGAVRDPRGWSLSIAYYALVPFQDISAQLGKDGVSLVPVSDVQALPFDHGAILAEAASRLLSKSTYSSLPVFLCEDEFTLPELQFVYESVLGEHIDKVTFRRKILDMGVIEPIVGRQRHQSQGRPAQLYRVSPHLKDTLGLTARAFKS